MTTSHQPTFLLFAQHGWNDDYRDMEQLAAVLAAQNTRIFTPDLGILNTWISIEPLINKVEYQLNIAVQWHPTAKVRIVAHSLGGLIWLEVLHRRSDILIKVDSLVLLGSPIGGSDLSRILDPFGMLPTIARDLGKDRRYLAEQIAKVVPTLIIAGDNDGGSDKVITVGSTQVEGTTHIRLRGIHHNALREPHAVAPIIRQFWGEPMEQTFIQHLIARLRAIPGMTDAHDRDFFRARTTMTFRDGTTIRLWKNPVGVDHVFVADPLGIVHFGGFVGWVHASDFRNALRSIQQEFQALSQ